MTALLAPLRLLDRWLVRRDQTRAPQLVADLVDRTVPGPIAPLPLPPAPPGNRCTCGAGTRKTAHTVDCWQSQADCYAAQLMRHWQHAVRTTGGVTR